MKKTRRAFGFSSLGFGAALASARPVQPNSSQPDASIRLHEDAKLSCFEVNLAKTPNSDLLAAFTRGLPGSDVGEILLTRSSDRGSAWSALAPLFPVAQPLTLTRGYQQASLTQLSNGAVIACTTKFSFLFDGKVAWRRGSQTEGVLTRISQDGGYRWSEITKVDVSPFRRTWTRGPIVETPDGTLLLPLAGQRRDGYHDFDEPIASFLLRSDDGGVAWKFHSIIAENSADCDEPFLLSLGGNRLLCAFRSHDSPRCDPLGGYIHMTMSSDCGATWTQPKATSMWGHPASLLHLYDERVLCAFGYRMHPNPGVRACVSEDGLTWKPSEIFAVNAIPDLDSEHLHIGCPSSVELEAGRILTAYQVWAPANNSRSDSVTAYDRQRLEGLVYRV